MTSEPKTPEMGPRRGDVVGVVGLGYAGLPLAIELGRAGYRVVGIDKDAGRVSDILAGRSYVPDVDEAQLGSLVQSGRLDASKDEAALAECRAVSICVPTPLRKTKDPDMSYVLGSCQALAPHLAPGALVILESTTYPGATKEVVLPILEANGSKAGHDFFLCFSPERVDPGNRDYDTRRIPKIIGGVTPLCTEIGRAYYAGVMDTVVPVSSSQVAEMVKLLENTFRMINIGLANETALMCDHMGIDVWEVIEAAATKPFGFMPFYPGPGLGGHCIPVDPHYLSWKSRRVGYEPRFIELATEINGGMPAFVAGKVRHTLNKAGKAVRGAQVHVVGVSYKRDVSDVRESPAVDIMNLLQEWGGKVSFSDPFVSRLRLESEEFDAVDLMPACAEADCVVIVTDHGALDYALIVAESSLIVDSRNALRAFSDSKIVRL